MDKIIECLEMLRLMCENHYERMQNFMRVQKEQGITRLNTVNMLSVVSVLLKQYADIMDDFNGPLGE